LESGWKLGKLRVAGFWLAGIDSPLKNVDLALLTSDHYSPNFRLVSRQAKQKKDKNKNVHTGIIEK